MIKVEISNVEQFTKSLENWVEKVEEQCADVANGLTVELFDHILQTSPQFSGDFAANWQYSINGANTTFTELNLLDHRSDPFAAGAHPAIVYAKAMNKGRDFGYKLGDTFYLSNSAYHDEPYALKIERGEIKFRLPVGNRGHTVENAFAHVLPKYTHITKKQAYKLARKKL